jgi:hypothetical protein
MGIRQDRDAAMNTLAAAQIAQKKALATTMAGVSVNTIAAGDITAINAAGAAYDAAILAMLAVYRSSDF